MRSWVRRGDLCKHSFPVSCATHVCVPSTRSRVQSTRVDSVYWCAVYVLIRAIVRHLGGICAAPSRRRPGRPSRQAPWPMGPAPLCVAHMARGGHGGPVQPSPFSHLPCGLRSARGPHPHGPWHARAAAASAPRAARGAQPPHRTCKTHDMRLDSSTQNKECNTVNEDVSLTPAPGARRSASWRPAAVLPPPSAVLARNRAPPADPRSASPAGLAAPRKSAAPAQPRDQRERVQRGVATRTTLWLRRPRRCRARAGSPTQRGRSDGSHRAPREPTPGWEGGAGCETPAVARGAPVRCPGRRVASAPLRHSL